MLREIAEADYGEMADEWSVLLEQTLRTGVAESFEPQLHEVLMLTHRPSRPISEWTV
jgi:hypothetical protein